MPINTSIRPAFLKTALIALGILAPMPQVLAVTTVPSTIAVSATVQATCLNTTTPIAFGTYTGVQADATGTITVTCTNTTGYTIGISAGGGVTPTATVTTRHMNGPFAAGLNYTLTSASPTGPNWGVTVGTDTIAGTGTGAAQPITVYGRAAAGQFITPGAYTDTVTATVTYN